MGKRTREAEAAAALEVAESAEAKAVRRAAKKARKAEAAQVALDGAQEHGGAVGVAQVEDIAVDEVFSNAPAAQLDAAMEGGEAVDTDAARAERKQRKKERRAAKAMLGGEGTQDLAVVAPEVAEVAAEDAEDDGDADEDAPAKVSKAERKAADKASKGKQQKLKKQEKEIAKMDAKIAKAAKKTATREGKAPVPVAFASGSGDLDPALMEASMDDILAALQGGSSRTKSTGAAGVSDALKTLKSTLTSEKKAKKALLPSAIKAKAGAAANKAAKQLAASVDYSSMTGAQVLSTQWLTAKEFKAHGIEYKKGKFSAAEDALIHSAIDLFAIEHSLDKAEIQHMVLAKASARREIPQSKLFWTSIASAIEGRPITSVYKRVCILLNPARQSGKWDDDELDALKAGVLQHGTAWAKIAENVGRSASDCRDRWTSAANAVGVEEGGTHKRGKWSSEEEEKLRELVGEHGQSWTVIAKILTSRTRSQCKTKWVDDLARKTEVDGVVPKWSSTHRGNLVAAVAKLDADDLSEIRWTAIEDPLLKPQGPTNLLAFWKRLTSKSGLGDDASHRDVVKSLLEKFPLIEQPKAKKKIATAKEKAAAKKVDKRSGEKKKAGAATYKSAEFISESDDE